MPMWPWVMLKAASGPSAKAALTPFSNPLEQGAGMKMPALLFVLPLTALAAGLSGCGVSETDTDRFEAAATRIAAIPLEPEAIKSQDAATGSSSRAPLEVQLVTPHQLWDARDGLAPAAAKVITLTQADLGQPNSGPTEMPQGDGVDIPVAMQAALAQPSARPAEPVSPAQGRMVQLGAYADQATAQAAWGRLGTATRGLSPVYEPVTVNGRDFVRLKVRAQSHQAQALCAVAAGSDAWCMKGAG